MPEMDGFEFAAGLRADPRTARLPVIALSSVVSAEAIERGRSVGFTDYVAKFDRQGLIAALQGADRHRPRGVRADMSTRATQNLNEYVTAMVGDQLFGLPILRVQDVFVPARVTRVPLAPPEIAGVLNLRGRIVTLIDLRCRLGLPPRAGSGALMAIGVEVRGESYGLLIDSIGEVLKLDDGRARAQSGQSRSAARRRVGRHLPAGRATARGGRRRSRSRCRAAGGRGVTRFEFGRSGINPRANMTRLCDENLFGR